MSGLGKTVVKVPTALISAPAPAVLGWTVTKLAIEKATLSASTLEFIAPLSLDADAQSRWFLSRSLEPLME